MELFKLFGSIFVENSEANNSIDETGNKADGAGSKLGKLGGIAKVAGGAIVAGIGVAAGAVTGLMTKTMQTANEINKFSQVNGMSTKSFQQWDHVAKSVGFSMEQASGDMAALAERAMDAASGAGENADMFRELGVSVMDNNGQLKTQEQLFGETIAGLQGMEDVTKRNAIATAMLSTTGEELAPILNMTAEELEKLKGSANVISEEDLAKAEQFNLKWNQAKNTLGSVGAVIGMKLMPFFETMLDWVLSNMPQIQSIIDICFNAISKVVNMAIGIFRDYFLPILSQIWQFIQTNLQPIFMALFSYMQGNLPIIKEVFTTVFSAIWEVLKTVWAIFKDNILPILISLYEWISGHMPAIRETFMAVFSKIKEVVSVAWAFFKDNLLPILSRLSEFIQSKMPQIQSIVEGVFKIIANVVKVAWDIFENLLLPILKALWDYIAAPAFKVIQTIVEEVFTAIFDAVEDVVTVFENVTDAIKKAVDWLTFWDDKEPKKKTLEVEEKRTTKGGKTPKNATGTNWFGGGYTLVGERGAELVELPTGSKIHPANQTRNMMNDGETTISIASAPVIIDKRVLGEIVFEVIDEIGKQNNLRNRKFGGEPL